MDEKIYDLLNDVEIDLDEYKEKELSSKEKQKIEDRLLREVRNMKNKKQENEGAEKRQEAGIQRSSGKTGRKAAGIAAAACIAVSAIAIGSNPVAAKALLSNLYEKIIAGSEGEKNADEIREIYTKIGEESVPANSVAESSGKASVLEAEDAGIRLRVCDIFCDGYKLYYTLELETDNEKLAGEEIDGIFSDVVSEKKEQTCEVWVDGENESFPFTFQKQADGTFTSVQDYNLFATIEPKSYENGDVLPIDICIKRFEGVDYDSHDAASGEYVHTDVVEGEWRLSFPVTVDTSANVVTEINKEDNGVRLVDAVRTKATLNLTVEAPDFSKEPYNDPYNDPEIGIKDRAGNWMQMLGCYDGVRDDGTHVYQITLLYNDEKEFYLDVTEKKNEDAKQIAGIAFHVE